MSLFRTIEKSSCLLGNSQLKFLTVKSKHLSGRGDICLFSPKNNDLKNLPIVILLHGVYGSFWSWAFHGEAHKTTQLLMDNGVIKPMIIAMPSDGMWGDGSGYLPHHGFDFEKWIVEDVPNVVIETLDSASIESLLFISGQSMGGFGALRIGAKYTKKFTAVSAHSSITKLDQMKLFIEEDIELMRQVNPNDEDVFKTILSNKHEIPAIRFDCGLNDSLLKYNRQLSNKLDDFNIHHIYEEFNGKHEWDYWKIHLTDSLIFFSSHI